MADKVKVVPLSETAVAVLNDLKANTHATVAELKVRLKNEKINSAHLQALIKRELVTSEEITVECETCGAKRKVQNYTITTKGLTA